MMNIIAKLDFRSARKLLFIFYSLSIATHILVLTKIIPYFWVNRRMSKSYDTQASISLASLGILILLFSYIWHITNPAKHLRNWQRHFLYFIIGLWLIGFAQQLLGTHFERYCLSVIILVGIVAHLTIVQQNNTHNLPTPNHE